MAHDTHAQPVPESAPTQAPPPAPQAPSRTEPAELPSGPGLMESAAGPATVGACSSCAASAAAQRADAYAQPDEDLASSPYVYAIGRIEARFPRLSVEKEFAQVSGRSDSAGLTDAQLLQSVLSEHRYLARLMCWVLLVREIETYILLPQDPMELQLLVDAVRPDPSLMDLDVVIGRRGPVASPDTCNGLTVPLVAVDQIYSFDRELFRRSIPKPDSVPDEQFQAVTAKVLDLILQVADNAGATEDHRALNYLAMRYPEIYKRTARAFDEDFSLSGVNVQRSSLSGARTVVDCIFTYTHRSTGFTEKAAVSVDVTDELPFLVSPLSTYYDRFSTR